MAIYEIFYVLTKCETSRYACAGSFAKLVSKQVRTITQMLYFSRGDARFYAKRKRKVEQVAETT